MEKKPKWDMPHTASLLLIIEVIVGAISLAYDVKSLATIPMILWIVAMFCCWEFGRLRKKYENKESTKNQIQVG